MFILTSIVNIMELRQLACVFPPMQEASGDKILKKAERSLLRVRIGQKVRKIYVFENKRNKTDVDSRLLGKQPEVDSFIKSAQLQDIESSSKNTILRLIKRK